MWTEMEARVGTFLAALIGTEAEMVISIFLAVKTDTAKRATIDTVASQKMSREDRERFRTIMNEVAKRYAERNTVVHGSWGISPVYPDALLWCDIRKIMMFHVEMMNIEPTKRTPRMVAEQKKMRVYLEADFLAIEERINTTYDELSAFSKPIMERSFGPHAKIDVPPTLVPQ